MSLNMIMGWLCCKIQDARERGKKEANEYRTGMLKYCSLFKKQDLLQAFNYELSSYKSLLTFLNRFHHLDFFTISSVGFLLFICASTTAINAIFKILRTELPSCRI